MAPKQSAENSSLPLADWFFICGMFERLILDTSTDELLGVDSEQLRWSQDDETSETTPPAPVEQTIQEERTAEAEPDAPEPPLATPRKTKRNSYQRLSNLSDEARLSISSLSFSPDQKGGSESNRSSTTIKAIQINGRGVGNGLNDLDFENALKKFASQRDSFLSDLTLSAGAVLPNRPKPRPKTQKITNEDTGGLKSGVGSIRRRISFRDMNSMKRQTSVQRQCKSSLEIRASVNQVPPKQVPLESILYPVNADTKSSSFYPYLKAVEQLQFCHS